MRLRTSLYLSVAAVGIAVMQYTSATPYPGVAALLPALGAVALLVGSSVR